MLTSNLQSNEMKALVVEDDLWMRPFISVALRLAIPEISIDWVESAEEAQNKTRYDHYMIIVSDFQLKPNRGTGMDLWRHCREECPETPVLMISSTPIDVFFKKAGRYAPPYLKKPFTETQLKDAVKHLISHHGLAS